MKKPPPTSGMTRRGRYVCQRGVSARVMVEAWSSLRDVPGVGAAAGEVHAPFGIDGGVAAALRQ
jgi:hypothetical protein